MTVASNPLIAASVRTFTYIVLSGFALLFALWGGLQWLALQSSFPEVEGMEQIQLAHRDAFALAGRLILFGGAVVVIAAALVAARIRFLRLQEFEALVDQLVFLREAEFESEVNPPKDRSPQMRRVYRALVEARDVLLRKIRRLDNERRHGFQVLGHMTDGVIAVSSNRRVLLVNRAAWKLLGITREKHFSGRACAEVVRVPQVLAVIDKVLAGSGYETVEFNLPGDRELPLRVDAVELPSGGDAGVLVTIRDESQVKHLEKLRREFIANVSHELKTPLAAVRGYAETLQLGAKDDPEMCGHFLKQIDVQSLRLERLINDMLQLARAQTGTEKLKLARLDIQPVVREAVTTYEPVANAKEIRLRFEGIKGNAEVIADHEAALTIANNLIGNAVRYTNEGGEVIVSLAQSTDYWSIIVEDDGMGIPEEDQQRIFERFYRVEKARDSTRGGTGLGLSIVKNLVVALRGQICLESQVGKGSKFEVRLPRPRPGGG